MVKVNGIAVPTCRELAKTLESYGDKPLFSGDGMYCIFGFGEREDGIQIAAKYCEAKKGGK